MNDTYQSRPATEPSALGRSEMELSMLAVRDHVPALRTLAAERAMRADHDLDFIDDVRLAVDEVCALVLANCLPTEVMTIRLLVDAGCLRIDAWVRTYRVEPAVGGLSLRVLRSLADSLDYWIDDTSPEYRFRLTFGWSRPTSRPATIR